MLAFFQNLPLCFAPVIHISWVYSPLLQFELVDEDETINPSLVNGYINVLNSWASRTQNVHTTGIKWSLPVTFQKVLFNRGRKKNIGFLIYVKPNQEWCDTPMILARGKQPDNDLKFQASLSYPLYKQQTEMYFWSKDIVRQLKKSLLYAGIAWLL